jgi:hypothetical protein
MTYLDQAPDWIRFVAAVLAAVYPICTALSFLLGVLGNRWPKLLVWARYASDVGLRVHQVGNFVGSLLPGGQPPAVAAAKSLRPRAPMPSLEMCVTCGQPVLVEGGKK